MASGGLKQVIKTILQNQGTLLKLEINGDNVRFTRTVANLKLYKVDFKGNSMQALKQVGEVYIEVRNQESTSKGEISIASCTDGVFTMPQSQTISV